MTWLAFLFALEFGFQSTNELMYSTPYFDGGSLAAGYQIESPYVTLAAAGELFKVLQIGGISQIYFADVEDWTYAPYDARFVFFIRATWRGFTAGWDHLCIHPISSPSRPDFGFLYGGGDKIYLRYEAKVGGK